jgi:hypothetical protein
MIARARARIEPIALRRLALPHLGALMARGRGRIPGAALAAVAMTGCASGLIPARLSVPGRATTPVTLEYRSHLLGTSGELSTALPTGERFAGGYTLTPKDPQSHMVGTLSGDKGSLLICRFRLNEPGIGPDRGGAVHCELSTGGTVDGRF